MKCCMHLEELRTVGCLPSSPRNPDEQQTELPGPMTMSGSAAQSSPGAHDGCPLQRTWNSSRLFLPNSDRCWLRTNHIMAAPSRDTVLYLFWKPASTAGR